MLQPPYYQAPSRTRKRLLPAFVTGVLAAIQMFLWMAIVGLEIASVYYDAGRGTIYAGFWCSIVFFITWVAMYGYVCCGRSTGCGVFLVVQNTINIAFAIILIVFTALFINDPCRCFGELCQIPNWDVIDQNNSNDFDRSYCSARTHRKLPVLKGLLSCAVLILASSVAFILAFILASIRMRRTKAATQQQSYQSPSAIPTAVETASQPPYYSPAVSYHAQHHRQPHSVQYAQTPIEWSSASSTYHVYTNRF